MCTAGMSAASRGTPRLLASRCSTFTLLHVFLALLGVGVLMTCLLHLIFTPPSHDRVTPACPDLSPSPSNHSGYKNHSEQGVRVPSRACARVCLWVFGMWCSIVRTASRGLYDDSDLVPEKL